LEFIIANKKAQMKEANMRTIVIFITVIALIVAAGLADSEADDKPTLYTAYNMWKSSKMKCINFKEGVDLLPAGTEVRSVRIIQHFIAFTTVNDGKTYSVGFTQRWHPKKTPDDYRKMMFTTKNLGELTEGLSEIEIDAIKKGILVNGMSKRAVFICYGPPPEHHTPNLDVKTWYYWKNRRDKFAVSFDQDQKLVLNN
jgi:hypothetical protein